MLTRLYTPDQFGYLSVYTAGLTIFGVIAVLGFELAIPIAASEIELANVLANSAVTLTATAGVICIRRPPRCRSWSDRHWPSHGRRLVLVVASVIVPWRLGPGALPAVWLTSLAQAICCAVMLALIAVSMGRIQPRAA